jgi:regulator of sigma E protease
VFSLAAGLPDLSSTLSIVKVVLGFGAVIFIHEFGHFLLARKNGVFVEKFAIGFDFFGAKLATWHRGGTEYVVGAFPVGGYVKMKGQHDMPGDEEEANLDQDSFQKKTVWQRTQIISAGVVANFLSAFVFCYLALVFGYHAFPPEVGQVSFEELEAGLEPGDQIVSLAGTSTSTWEEMLLIYATQEPGAPVVIEVERQGSIVPIELTVQRDPGMPLNYPGFTTGIELTVGVLSAGLPAEKGGVLPGDGLVSIDGKPIRSWSDFQQLVRRRAGQEMSLRVQRAEDQFVDLNVTPEARSSDRVPRYRPGFEPQQAPVLDFVQKDGPAWLAGLRPGDLVLSVGEEPVTSWYGLWRSLTWSQPEDSLHALRVQRGDEEIAVEVRSGPYADWGMELSSHTGLRIAGRPPERLVVGTVDPEFGPKELMPGDVITSVAGQVKMPDGTVGDWSLEDPSWRVVLSVLNQLQEPEITYGVERDGMRHEFSVKTTEEPNPVFIGHVGVGPHQKEVLVQYSPIEAIGPALKAPFRILKDFVDGIRAMAMRRVSTKMLAGPVGILQATYTFAEKSTGDLLNFLALLSVNLAIVNFLPIPITDGGHFVFLMYEKLKGRRMDDELMARFQWAGLVFLLMVFLFATFNDVERLIGF